MTEIIYSMFFNYNGMKLQIIMGEDLEIHKYMENKYPLNNQWVKEENTKEIQKIHNKWK